MSTFIASTAYKSAQEIEQAQPQTFLSDDAFDVFATAVDHPGQPNKALVNCSNNKRRRLRMPDAFLKIRPFNKALHDRRDFSSGIAQMDRWLRESAAEQIKRNRLRLWCATNQLGAFVGYYALAMHSVTPNEANNLSARAERHPIPAIYLSALAVAKDHQDQGIRGAVLGNAIIRCVALSDEIGAAAIILDVLEDAHFVRRKAFYQNLGIAEINRENPNRLFLSIKDAKVEMGK